MGWISSFPSHESGLLVRTRNSTGRNTPGVARAKVICLAASFWFMLALFSSLPNLQAEENGNERKVIAWVEPEYPETLQRLYIGGVVRLELTITAKGQVEKVTLLGGNPILGQSAMAAAKKWKYAPANSRTVTEVKIPFDPHR
jgi:TonB family protein